MDGRRARQLANVGWARDNWQMTICDRAQRKQNGRVDFIQTVRQKGNTTPPHLFEPRAASSREGRDKKCWSNFLSRPDEDRPGQNVETRRAVGFLNERNEKAAVANRTLVQSVDYSRLSPRTNEAPAITNESRSTGNRRSWTSCDVGHVDKQSITSRDIT